MLNSKTAQKFTAIMHWPLLAMLLIFSACLPQETPGVGSGSNVTNPENPNTPNYPEPSFPLTGTFITEGGQNTSSNFALPTDFTDSFQIRGKALSQYIRSISNSTKLCLVSKFNYGTGSDRFLLLSAKIQSKVDFANKTSEYFLLVSPNNGLTNETDCLNYNLSQKLLNSSQFPNPSLHFSFSSLCQDCTSLVTGTGFMLYFANGEAVSALNTQALILSLTHSTSGGGQACVESSVCRGQGFDCCLDGNCVKDRAERPDAYQKPRYQAALEDVKNNPSRYVAYPEIYYVCGEGSGTGGGTGGTPPIDPIYEAAKRIRELKHIHDCLNKVDGDFSHCTVKYEDAYKAMPGDFSSPDAASDINFSSLNNNFLSGKYANNIYRIFYAGEVIYDQETKPTIEPTKVAFGAVNDNLTAAQSVNLNLSLPSNAQDSILYLTYKVDGTCEKIGSTRGKCTKTYTHDAGDAEKYSSLWHSSSQFYALPSYADLSGMTALTVKVNGIQLPMSDVNWNIQGSGINFIKPLYRGQKVEITYFVTQNIDKLLALKNLARNKINSICACDTASKCNLKPVKASSSDTVVNYECIYESVESGEPPANQSVNITSKHVPQRYFDLNGVVQDENHGSAEPQEGKEFNYVSRNVLRPNNIDQYVGFNEIYGSFAALAGQDAQPAKMIRVKKDVTYDILANGSFAPCSGCGSDYYGNQSLFPFNPQGKAGGYAPDIHTSSRTSNLGLYRSDDLLFGRACFVPATMIPWTHTPAGSVETQRRNRLAGQHFLFANGYNRDWFGFDYGSVIGSFDGVTWFSVGSVRRIKAKSNKLFLAVNTFAGDLNGAGSFQISVSEMTQGSSEPIPERDADSDGAQCQNMHLCSNDNDCVAQLGYEYSCESVSSIRSKWPIFDNNASELIDPSATPRSLTSIIGGIQGNAKRCVYRGRGAPCEANLANIPNADNTFNGSSFTGTQMCSTNTSCAPLDTAQFNDRIARYGQSPAVQNASTFPPTRTDTHGQGARIVLRPYDYNGTKTTPGPAKTALVGHNVRAVCIPGKDITGSAKVFDLNARVPTNKIETSDRIFGIGPTTTSFSIKSMNACPAVDHAGYDIHDFDLNLGDQTLNLFTVSQNLSTNLLDFAPLEDTVFSTKNGSRIERAGYQRNACLRAPGASCFSDMECAPSPFIASKVKAATLTSLLNSAEIKYWSEELVCGNPDFKQIAPGILNPNFDPKKNVCCRDFGNTFTVFTETATSDYKWCTPTGAVQVAGVNVDYKTQSRYSRVNTAFDKLTCNVSDTSKSFALSLNVNGTGTPTQKAETRLQQILSQFKTLSTVNERTCCTKNWVRNFSNENGGGHAFTKSKLQNIDKAMFRNLNWLPQDTILGVADSPFECLPSNYGDISCEVKNFTQSEEDKYLTWAASFELVGIPQVAIATNNQVFKIVDDLQEAPAGGVKMPLTDSQNRQIIKDVATTEADFIENTDSFYSAASYPKLNMVDASKNSLKKVFSEDEFSCCIPTGQEVPSGTTPSQCCTGNLANVGGPLRCCLPDYTDVTLYLNRYVSSQGAGLPDSAYDLKTGYIKDPVLVQTIAAQKNICCSGLVATGVAISRLLKPIKGDLAGIPVDTLSTTRRFIYRDDIIDNNAQTGSVGTKFDRGVRWNNHLYCVPQGFAN